MTMTSRRVNKKEKRLAPVIELPRRPNRTAQETASKSPDGFIPLHQPTIFIPRDTFDGHLLTRDNLRVFAILANERSDEISRRRAQEIFDRKANNASEMIDSHNEKKRRHSRKKLLESLKFFMGGIDSSVMDVKFDSLVLTSQILGALMADPVQIADEAHAIALEATQILGNPALRTWHAATALSLQHILPALDDEETHNETVLSIFDVYIAEINTSATNENIMMLGAVCALMPRIPNVVECAYRPMLEKLFSIHHHGESDAVKNAAEAASSSVIKLLPGGILAAIMPALRAQFPPIRPL